MRVDSLKELLPDHLRPGLRSAYWAALGIVRRTANLRLKRSGAPHIHFLRETEHRGNGAFLEWVASQRPHLAGLFRVSASTDRSLQPWEGAALFVPWLQDPVYERDPALFERVQALERAYVARGVPVINPVAAVSNAIKSRALKRTREAGVRAARAMPVGASTPFEAIAEALGTPFILRNDRGHGGYLGLIHTPADLQHVPWGQLPHPLAVEFIDTRGGDGLFRKYRLLFTGAASIPRHLVITPSWSARAEDRLRGGRYLAEEMVFLQAPSPFHNALDRVRRALELDYVAFDFSVTPDGELVVWEPNPYPVLWGPAYEASPDHDYQRPQIDAIFAHVLRYYLTRGGLHTSPPHLHV